MSGNKYPKKFQLHLTEAQHEALRQAAFTAKVSMMEYVRGRIGPQVTVDKPGYKTTVITETRPINPNPLEQPKVDQKTCKHSYTAPDSGGMICWKCGYRAS